MQAEQRHQRVTADLPDKEHWKLTIETVNGSAWSFIKGRLEETEATVVLAQEVRLTAAFAEPASGWAARRGWTSAWAPSCCTATGRATGGVAIFVRSWLGFRPLAAPAVSPEYGHRVVFGLLQAPGYGDIVLGSLYLIDSIGLAPANVEILGQVGAFLGSRPEQFVIGADWQMAPTDLDAAG